MAVIHALTDLPPVTRWVLAAYIVVLLGVWAFSAFSGRGEGASTRELWALGTLAALITFLALESVIRSLPDLSLAAMWAICGAVAILWWIDGVQGFEATALRVGLVVAAGLLLVVERPPAGFVFNGLVVGSVYAIAAVGLTLVYGILNLVNFAHGDLLTLGMFTGWALVTGFSGVLAWQYLLILAIPLLLVLLLSLAQRASTVGSTERSLLAGGVVTLALLAGLLQLFPGTQAIVILATLAAAASTVALLSIGLEVGLWRRMRRERANLLTLMVISIGVAFALRSTLQIIFGGDLRPFFQQAGGANQAITGGLARIGLESVTVTTPDLWVLGVSLFAALVTYAVLNHTRSGKAMRALADNLDLARVTGIDTDRVVLHVWLLGGALAGVAGVLMAMDNTGFNVQLGWTQLLPIFAAVILGGVGSVQGAMLGGLVIGLAQEVSVAWIAPGYKVGVGFAILIVVLLARPQGIMGVERT